MSSQPSFGAWKACIDSWESSGALLVTCLLLFFQFTIAFEQQSPLLMAALFARCHE